MSAEVECKGLMTKSGIRQPPIRTFMDDLTVTTKSPRCRQILWGLEQFIVWARMSFNTKKSRSLVLRGGKVVDWCWFTVRGTSIPSLTEKTVKSLGKVFNSSLKDTESIKTSMEEPQRWLTTVRAARQV